MRKTLLAVLILGLAANASAVQARKSNKANSQAPTLAQSAKKPEELHPKPELPVVLQPFSLETLQKGQIDPKFEGVPASVILQSLESVTKIKKGEFESTAEFESRKGETLAKKLVGDIGINDLLPFVVQVKKLGVYSNGLMYSYNADSAEASLYVLPSAMEFNGIGGPEYKFTGYSRPVFDTLDLGTQFDKSRTYEASNAYGATVTVEETRGTRYGVASERISYIAVKRQRFYEHAEPVITIKMDTSTAAKELPALKALLVLRVKSPYVMYDFFHSKPTRDNPREITVQQKSIFGEVVKVVFYSGISGQILAQFPEAVESAPTNTTAP